MDYADVLDKSLQKKINSMPKESEIIPLGNLDEKMNQLISCVDKMTTQKNNEIDKLNDYREQRKNKEEALKQIKEEIKELEIKQNMVIIELEKDNKALRFQNMHKTKNTKAKVDNDSVQNDIAKKCDEIQQLVGNIQTYEDYTITISSEIEQKKKTIEIIKAENRDLTKELNCLLDKEKKSILDVKKIIDQINTQEIESKKFLNNIEQKVNTLSIGGMHYMPDDNNSSNNNEEEDNESKD